MPAVNSNFDSEEPPFPKSPSPESSQTEKKEGMPLAESENGKRPEVKAGAFPSPPAAEAVSSNNSSNSLIKKIGIVLAIILTAGMIIWAFFRFLLPRFQGKPVKRNSQVTLTYWGLWESKAVMNSVLAAWAKEHPEIKINYVLQSPKEYRERLQSALARGEGPDIFRFHITWVPMFKNELDPVPSSVMNASQFETSFYPVAVKHLRSGSNFLGLPLMMDTLALFYNEDLFQAAGEKPPSSWDKLRQTAADLAVRDANGRLVVGGVGLGTTNNVDHWSDILGLMMLQNGADLAHPSTCSQQGEEKVCLAANALSFFTNFNRVDRVWDETMPPSTMAFATGKLAMYFGPSWRIFDIKQINPQLKFKVVPVPQLSGVNVNWGSFWVEGVGKGSKHKRQAWEFLKFLTSQKTMEDLYQTASKTRLFGELYSRVEMASRLQNPLIKPFLDQAPQAQTWYLCSQTYDNGINDRMIKYFEDAVNAVNAGKSAQQALETASQGVSQLLSQYGIEASIVR